MLGKGTRNNSAVGKGKARQVSANDVGGLMEGQEPRRERNRKRVLKWGTGLF